MKAMERDQNPTDPYKIRAAVPKVLPVPNAPIRIKNARKTGRLSLAIRSQSRKPGRPSWLCGNGERRNHLLIQMPSISLEVIATRKGEAISLPPKPSPSEAVS
jgi:hypothetical protein